MNRHFLSLALFLFAWQPVGIAREVYYGTEPEAISIAYGGPTIFRFNEPVKTISQASRFMIKPADDGNPDYSMLSVVPRFTQGSDKITFILANGAVVNAKVTTVSKALPERTDSFYDFKPKGDLIKRSGSEDGALSEIELMKAMIRGDSVPGFSMRPSSIPVRTGVPNISAVLAYVYTGPNLNGYVFKVINTSKKTSYEIDLEQLSLGRPNTALLSQVDLKKLKGGAGEHSSTYLRIVAKPASVYYNVNLPIAAITEKK